MSQINSSLDCPRSIENISSLWDQTSTQSVVLVLPDALRSKYYLKDYHGKIERDKARKEREMKRYEFLSQRMATAAMKNRKTMEVILSSERKRARGLVERELDEKMIEPLRKDEKALEFFLQRIQEIKKQRNEHVKKVGKDFISISIMIILDFSHGL